MFTQTKQKEDIEDLEIFSIKYFHKYSQIIYSAVYQIHDFIVALYTVQAEH